MVSEGGPKNTLSYIARAQESLVSLASLLSARVLVAFTPGC
jgi:hypothetical protein